MIVERVTLRPMFNPTTGVIAIDEETQTPSLESGHDLVGEMISTHQRWIVDTRDQLVRKALIKLGWTPPPG